MNFFFGHTITTHTDKIPLARLEMLSYGCPFLYLKLGLNQSSFGCYVLLHISEKIAHGKYILPLPN